MSVTDINTTRFITLFFIFPLVIFCGEKHFIRNKKRQLRREVVRIEGWSLTSVLFRSMDFITLYTNLSGSLVTSWIWNSMRLSFFFLNLPFLQISKYQNTDRSLHHRNQIVQRYLSIDSVTILLIIPLGVHIKKVNALIR